MWARHIRSVACDAPQVGAASELLKFGAPKVKPPAQIQGAAEAAAAHLCAREALNAENGGQDGYVHRYSGRCRRVATRLSCMISLGQRMLENKY